MTLYRKNLETVGAFHYEAALETMDFKYPFPDWLQRIVTVRENSVLQLETGSGVLLLKPGQWVIKDKMDNLHVLNPDDFHRSYKALSE